MKRILAWVITALLLTGMTATVEAERPELREGEVMQLLRSIMTAESDPLQIVKAAAEHSLQFVGYGRRQVTYQHTGRAVVASLGETGWMGPDLVMHVERSQAAPPADWGPPQGPRRLPSDSDSDLSVLAGQKVDLTLTLWLFEWQRPDGTYRQQAVINGYWSSTEYPWVDDPADVIDVRWIVGDLVYLSSAPLDGVQRDQHTQGIASFTVDDQVRCWDLFVSFRPVSTEVHGRWTNLFVNFTHTWWGARLSVTLGAGPTGSTGSISISTDAHTWTEGTGLAFQIGSGRSRGPVQTGLTE